MEMASIQVERVVTGPFDNVTMRCPHCGAFGVFVPVSEFLFTKLIDERTAENLACGARVCPSEECRRLVFLVARGGEPLIVFPAERLDFDATSLPEDVRSSLEEAIQCHSSGCYRAAALMIRRTLEEMCHDRGAKGANLHARIQALGGTIVIPRELLEVCQEIRLLGNDAAHVEAAVYEQIGREEIETAIMLTKEILKATYQYADLVERLRQLRTQKKADEKSR